MKNPAAQPVRAVESEANGLSILKIRTQGTGGYVVSLPRHLCNRLEMLPGMSFVAVRAIGPCLVISRVTDVSSPGATRSEADKQVEKLVSEWSEKQ